MDTIEFVSESNRNDYPARMLVEMDIDHRIMERSKDSPCGTKKEQSEAFWHTIIMTEFYQIPGVDNRRMFRKKKIQKSGYHFVSQCTSKFGEYGAIISSIDGV